MTTYLVFFGRTPELSWAELASLYPTAVRITAQAGILEISDATDIRGIIDELGGAVKAAKLCGSGETVSLDDLAGLLTGTGKKVLFGISVYGMSDRSPKDYAERLKQILSDRGVKSRYVVPEHGSVLSSVQARSVCELVIVEGGGKVYWGVTAAVQDIEKWQDRDYGRPFADARLGMLPPKVARMAINVALGQDRKGRTILDPFCGMGTILAEGLISGCNVIGGDISPEIIKKAEDNLQWLKKKYAGVAAGSIAFYVSDATHISDLLAGRQVDAVVTEPFMGTPRLGERGVSVEKVKNIVKGLDKLMIGCLKDWARLVKPEGRVFVAMPTIAYAGGKYSVKRAIDTCERLGYTKVLGPITYAREQAVVQRDFYLLKRN